MSKENDVMDLVWKKFGRLFVVGYNRKDGKNHIYNCLCDCTEGQDSRPIVKVNGKYLKDGSCQSCGCLRAENAKNLPRDNNQQVFSNSEIKELPYYKEIKMIWVSNRNHCYNSEKAHSFYKKGLKFCPEWDNGFLGFLHFYIWCIDNSYIAGKSQVDRINKNKGFNPKNCRIIDKPIGKVNKPEKQKAKNEITKDKLLKNDLNNDLLSTSDEVKAKLKDFLNSVGIEFKTI